MASGSSVDCVSVVITHYKSPAALNVCLGALRGIAGLDVVVCDSEAEPGVEELIDAVLPGARYVGFARNVGYGALVNAGFESTKSEYVFVMNADTTLTASALSSLVALLDRSPEVGLVAPRLRFPDGRQQDSAFSFYRPVTVFNRRTPLGRTSQGRLDLARFRRPMALVEAGDADMVEADWVLGAAFLVRREAIASVGPFDHRYFLYFEDVDWCLRMWRQGWRVGISTDAVCEHGLAKASEASGLASAIRNRLFWVHVRSAVRFFAKHGLAPTRGKRARPTVTGQHTVERSDSQIS
nr:glycosyltransferase family 2 protein [Cryptosporangium arvum]